MSRTPRPTFWSAPPRRSIDETDYEHRHFVNLVAVAALLLLAVAIVWDVKTIDDNQRMERCFASGRRDCMQLSIPAGTGVLMLDRHHP